LLAQEVEYYHLDAIGNVRAVTDQNGRVVERHDYLPFGEECTTGACASNPGLAGGQPKRFTGKERDTETGLDYFGARYYGPKTGRFTTLDPVADLKANLRDPQRWNRYAYGRDNPLRFVDPDGRLTIIINGTFAPNAEYAQHGSAFNAAVSRTFGEQAVAFSWSGENNVAARAEAARQLWVLVKGHHFVEGESLNMVAHSHGGNVVKAYTQLAGARSVDTLVNLGTPQRSDYSINNSLLGRYVNAYDPWDAVQTNGGRFGMKAGRTDSGATNISIPSGHSGVAAHSGLHEPAAWSVIDKALLADGLR
jgi:RHS repeat-associated protein